MTVFFVDIIRLIKDVVNWVIYQSISPIFLIELVELNEDVK